MFALLHWRIWFFESRRDDDTVMHIDLLIDGE